MFYVFMVPLLLLLFYMIIYLRKLKKHDIVLYKFCQLRREAISILAEKNFNLSRDEYFSVRNLITILNSTIHNYNEYKTAIFDMRKLLKHFRDLKTSAKEIEKLELPQNQQIEKLYNKFLFSMFYAFFAYTPFLKSEIILNIIAYAFGRVSEKITRNIQWLKKETHKLNYPLGFNKNIIHS